MPALPRLALACLLSIPMPAAVRAQAPLQSLKLKDRFALMFPSGASMKSDSDSIAPTVTCINGPDATYRVEAKICRPDQQEPKLSMEKVFWASGIPGDEIVKKEQLPNGDFFLTGLHGRQAKAVFFSKGAQGYLQVTVEGADTLAPLLAKIARSFRNLEPAYSAPVALPLKLAEFVYEKDSVRILVPEGAKTSLAQPSAFWLTVSELDNIRVYTMSGFDYPYDELGQWTGAPADEREVAGNRAINFDVHVMELKPRGGWQEFYCYLGKEHENKIVISGPREYSDVMKLMAESVGLRSAPAATQAPAPVPMALPAAKTPAAPPPPLPSGKF